MFFCEIVVFLEDWIPQQMSPKKHLAGGFANKEVLQGRLHSNYNWSRESDLHHLAPSVAMLPLIGKLIIHTQIDLDKQIIRFPNGAPYHVGGKPAR